MKIRRALIRPRVFRGLLTALVVAVSLLAGSCFSPYLPLKPGSPMPDSPPDSSAWQLVGPAGFSAGDADSLTLAFSPTTGRPYVAYTDVGNGERATVMEYNGTSWVPVGLVGFSVDEATQPVLKFSASGIAYVAFMDADNSLKATVMKYNGLTWETVGAPGFSISTAWVISLALSPTTGYPYVAYRDQGTASRLTVMGYDGIDWLPVGGAPGISVAGAGSPSLAFSPTTGRLNVAFIDAANSSMATLLEYDGAAWAAVGPSGFSGIDQVWYTALAFSPANGQPYVAYSEWFFDNKAFVMAYDGTNWDYINWPGAGMMHAGFSVGPAGGVRLAFSPTTEHPYVAFADGANDFEATVMAFDGLFWQLVGSAGFSPEAVDSISLAFSPTGHPYVAFKDAVSGKATVMMFK